jgi:hypothetical protein
MPESNKNTKVKSPSRPPMAPPIKPQIPKFQNFQKPVFGNPKFKGPNTFSNTAFRNQNRGSGGK